MSEDNHTNGEGEMPAALATADVGEQPSSNVIAFRSRVEKTAPHIRDVVTVLEDAIKDVRSGKINPKMLFIGMYGHTADTVYYPYYITGMSLMETRGLLLEFLMSLGTDKDHPPDGNQQSK